MSKKEEYKQKNQEYLEEIASREGMVKLPCGIIYKVLQEGNGTACLCRAALSPSITGEP